MKIDFTVWNHFETRGPRTNNHVEGYNNKLKKFIGSKSPNIYKMIESLTIAESTSSMEHAKALAGFDPPSLTIYSTPTVLCWKKKELTLKSLLPSFFFSIILRKRKNEKQKGKRATKHLKTTQTIMRILSKIRARGARTKIARTKKARIKIAHYALPVLYQLLPFPTIII